MGNEASGPGTGSKLTKATITVCGVAALVASLLSFLYAAYSFDFLYTQLSPELMVRYFQIGMAPDVSNLCLISSKSLNRKQQELPQATLAAICHSHIAHVCLSTLLKGLALTSSQGAHLCSFVLGKHHVTDSGILPRSPARHLRGRLSHSLLPFFHPPLVLPQLSS